MSVAEARPNSTFTRVALPPFTLKTTAGRVLLRTHGARDVDDAGELLELDGRVDAEVGTRARGQRAVDAQVDEHGAVDRGRIDARDARGDDAVARVDLRDLSGDEVLRLRLRDADLGFQAIGLRDTRQRGAGVDALSGLHGDGLQDAVDAGADLEGSAALPLQVDHRPPLLDLGLQRREARALGGGEGGQALFFEFHALVERIRGGLGELLCDRSGQAGGGELRIRFRAEPGLLGFGTQPCGCGLLVEAIALQLRLRGLVCGFGGAQLPFGVARRLLLLRVAQFDDDRCRR